MSASNKTTVWCTYTLHIKTCVRIFQIALIALKRFDSSEEKNHLSVTVEHLNHVFFMFKLN